MAVIRAIEFAISRHAMCNQGDERMEAQEELTTMKSNVATFQPENFLRANQSISSTSLTLLRCIYDFTKQQEAQAPSIQKMMTFSSVPSKSKSKKKKHTLLSTTERPVNNLIVESFDSDQIWQELQLQNNLMYETLVSSTSKILAKNHNFRTTSNSESHEQASRKRQRTTNDNHPDFEDSEEEEEDNESVVEFEGLGSSNTKSRPGKGLNRTYPKSEVDDKFFNLAQMTEFLEKVEAQIESQEPENVDSEDDIDLFEEIDEDSGEEKDEDEFNLYYDKFFDKPLDNEENEPTRLETREKGQKSVRWNLGKAPEEGEDDQIEEEVDDDNEEGEEPSNFERRRRKIEENIELIEQAALEAKPWKYQGEITAEKRPENSLLEEHLTYDSLVRSAPEITVETTLKLEDIIKQRIKDKAWDDVERKVKPIEDPNEFKKKVVLSAEKSKMSLAQIYEQEYIDKKKAEEGETEVESKPEEEIVIERDMKTLFAKLDALSNCHYTPKAVSAEIRIVTNVPAIAMEEVAPVTVADSTLLAPQEIQAPVKGVIKGKDERTDTDRKRERRFKKKKQKFIHSAREEKAKAKEARLEAKMARKLEEKERPRKNQIKFK